MGILRNFSEVLRGLKRRGPVKKLCPSCGGSKLLLSSRFDIWLTPEQYICESCGYKGPIVMEVEAEETPEGEG
ncbi:MAG: hypothetical protein JSW53_03595 [Candidatus Bathyarchaeota archaeon]|nr:MAG: hypothetical protein JSW53_03595 [Candidatus Bathyarchaeota archaeon]